MYNLKNVSSVQEPFPVICCNANVYLDKMEYGKTDEGNEYLDIFYTDGKHTVKDRRFAVTKKNLGMMQREGETLQVTFDRLVEEASRVYRFIAERFCPPEEVDSLGGNDFKDFAENFMKIVGPRSKEVPLYLKIVVNKAGYPSVPRAGRFLQNMDEGSCTLSYTKKELENNKKYAVNEGISEVTEAVEDDLSD